jgi:hypothetical protein
MRVDEPGVTHETLPAGPKAERGSVQALVAELGKLLRPVSRTTATVGATSSAPTPPLPPRAREGASGVTRAAGTLTNRVHDQVAWLCDPEERRGRVDPPGHLPIIRQYPTRQSALTSFYVYEARGTYPGSIFGTREAVDAVIDSKNWDRIEQLVRTQLDRCLPDDVAVLEFEILQVEINRSGFSGVEVRWKVRAAD